MKNDALLSAASLILEDIAPLDHACKDFNPHCDDCRTNLFNNLFRGYLTEYKRGK